MLLGIQHETLLTYGARIRESVLELRVTPRSDKNQTLRAFTLQVGPEVPVFTHRDWNDNQVHHFTVASFHERVVIAAGANVETTARSRGDEIVAPKRPFPLFPDAVMR